MRNARKFACTIVALAAALASGMPVAGAAEMLHREKSVYRDIFVYDEGDLRCLTFTRPRALSHGARQSCRDKQAPQRLVFDYARMMMSSLFLTPAPRDILIVGLGGGTLPSALAQVLPGAKIDVVEIDPAVVRVAKRYFEFDTGPNIRIYTQDGRVFVKRAQRDGRRYDLIMLDAFDHEYIPEHLLTREYLEEVKSILRDGGVVAANTFSSSRLYDSESATYATVFGPFYNLKSDNRVILARKGPLPPLAEIERNARELELRFKPLEVHGVSVLPLFTTEPDWNRTARVLTDQYSPSNLLNSRG